MVLKRFGASIRFLSGKSSYSENNGSRESTPSSPPDLEKKQAENAEKSAAVKSESCAEDPSEKEHSSSSARGFFNEFSLLWVYPLLWKGLWNNLDPRKDTPLLPSKIRADNLIPKALKSFEKNKSIYKVFWDVASYEVILGVLVSIVAGLLTTVARPVLLGLIVEELERVTEENENDNSFVFKLIGGLCLVLLLEGWTNIVIRHSLTDFCGSMFFTLCAGLLQDKSQKVSCVTTTTQEASLLGNDVIRIYDSLRFAVLLPMALSGLIGGIVVLVLTIGKASIVGLVVMFFILLCNAWISQKASQAEEEDLFAADKRLEIMKQMITGIKAIKLCAWEENFLKSIFDARDEEMRCLSTFRVYQQSSVQLGRACPVLCAAASFLYLAISGDGSTSAEIFAALNVFLSLRLALIIIPESITYYAAAVVSIKRMHDFLNQPDIQDLNGERNKSANLLQEGTFSWSKEDLGFLVQGKFYLPPGKSLAIVSKVGNGKTSLLHSIIGELCASGNSSIVSCDHERISFIPQHPFILSGTVLENIVVDCSTEEITEKIKMHRIDAVEDEVGINVTDPGLNTNSINMERVKDAIQRSALEEDLKLLANGLYTRIGERGVTLSGGQQQRLIIARALYHNPTLIIADDPLAAVDHKVADHLFEEAFMKHMKRSDDEVKEEKQSETSSHIPHSLVMALNQPRYLPRFDYICKLDNGRITMFEEVTEASLLRAGDEAASSNNSLVQRKTNQSLEEEPASSEKTSQSESSAQLVEEDYSASGLVSSQVVIHYIRGMGFCLFFGACLVGLITYAAMAFQDLWLAKWVDESSSNDDRTAEEIKEHNSQFAIVYGIACLAFLSLLLLTSYMFSIATVRGSKSLHEQAMNRLMHAPITWFEQTPSGRITTRFTSDLSSVDNTLARFVDNFWQLLATLMALVVVVSVLVPPISIVIVISVALYGVQVVGVDRANRVIKREANLLMNPIQLILSEGVDGRVTSRVMGYNNRFRDRLYEAIDNWNRQAFCSLGVVNASMQNAYLMSVIISAATALYIVLSDKLSPAEGGLALTYSFLIPYFLLYSSFVMTIIMTSLSSLERVMDYIGDAVPQEPSWYTSNDPETSWPKSGSIEFKNVSLVYRKGLDPAIKNISFEVKSSEKIGIIGRTGAGKSSIILLLLRILDPTTGTIKIDGIDTTKIGLLSLRRAISIIPQRPLLLRGSVRENVAPFGSATFDELKLALIHAGLFGSTQRKKNMPISAASVRRITDVNEQPASDDEIRSLLAMDANSLSAGQKQLLSLARCLVNRNTRILVCDEPTSNVDVVTDQIVQKVLRTEFKHATCITIAHRLETIADNDRILVMEQGEIEQFDVPAVVLASTEL